MAMQAGSGDELNAEINVTPFVDVMLVLLIIFMITAPMMNNTGVELQLPQVAAKNLEDPEGKLVLSIKKTHEIFLAEPRSHGKISPPSSRPTSASSERPPCTSKPIRTCPTESSSPPWPSPRIPA